MPFDDTGYRDSPPAPSPPRRKATWEERALLTVLMLLAFAALLAPLTAASFGDVVRALGGNGSARAGR